MKNKVGLYNKGMVNIILSEYREKIKDDLIISLKALLYPNGKYGVRKTTTHNQAIALCIGKVAVYDN